MNAKFAAIASLEHQLKEVEMEMCFAMREGDQPLVDELFLQRGEVIWELQQVR